jgi:hypothetical protein
MTDDFSDDDFSDEEFDDIISASDLLIGFAWHEEGQHWHPAAFSYPDTFSEEQVDQLEQLAGEFADRLSSAGLTLPPEGAQA